LLVEVVDVVELAQQFWTLPLQVLIHLLELLPFGPPLGAAPTQGLAEFVPGVEQLPI
jgi:hypothetical protein